VPSDHQTHHAPWSVDGNRGRRTRPRAAAVALLNLPSTLDAKFKHPAKCSKANIHKAFRHVHPIKSPTRLPEEPKVPSASFGNRVAPLRRSRGRIRRYWAAAGFWSFWVGSLHEFVGWLLGSVPLDHLPSANITIDAAAVSNGQFGIAHEVLRPAVPTDKVTAIGECWGAHRGIICALAPQHASARQPI